MVYCLIYASDTALVSRCHLRCVGAQCAAHMAVASSWSEGILAVGFLLGAACGEFLIGDAHGDAATRDVDVDDVAVTHQGYVASGSSLGRDVTDRESGSASRETSVGNQGALLAEMLALDIAGGVEHLLHAGTSLGSLVGDDYYVAALYLVTEDTVDSLVLAVEYLRRT